MVCCKLSQSGIAIHHILRDLNSSAMEMAMISIMIHALLISIFGIVFYKVFGKATYPEVSFIMIAASLTVIMDLRVFFLVSGPLSLADSHTIQKSLYFLWLLSALLFFCSGLFHNGVAYLKQHFFFLISLCTATLFVYLLPITTDDLMLLHPRADDPIMIFIRLLELFAILNYVIAALRNNNKTFYTIAFGLFLFIAGNEFFLIITSPLLLIAGTICLTAGSIILIRAFYLLHLWS